MTGQIGRIDFAIKFRSARDALFSLLYDCSWHGYKELRAVAGLRYGARLLELKRLGYLIETQPMETGQEYRLISLYRGEPQEKRVKCFLTEQEAVSIGRGVPTHGAVMRVRDALDSFRANREKL